MLARDAREHWEESAERIRTETPFSPWLKQHLTRALARPPADALEDAELLRAVLRGRLGEELCGDPLADVPLPACDPLASRDLERPGARESGAPCAEALLHEVAALLPRDRTGAALLYLDAVRHVVERAILTGDEGLGPALAELFARARQRGACTVLLLHSAAGARDASAWTLLHKRVLETASLFGVAVEVLEVGST
jgi:hypothetical protein